MAGRVDEAQGDGSRPAASPVDGRAIVIAAPEHDLANAADLASFNEQLLKLLERRTAIYTMGDSTSVPRHVAGDLLLSICFVLGIEPDAGEIPDRLLGANLEAEFARGIADIERRMLAAEELLEHVRATMPPVDNIALRDTLKELGEFFKRYDYRSMAHEIPIMIDYPLVPPVDESRKGIAYIETYIARLAEETEYLSAFDLAYIERAMAAASFDPVEDLVNIGEAVAEFAAGRALIGDAPVDDGGQPGSLQ